MILLGLTELALSINTSVVKIKCGLKDEPVARVSKTFDAAQHVKVKQTYCIAKKMLNLRQLKAELLLAKVF